MRASDSPGVRANVLADRRSVRAAREKAIHFNLHVWDPKLGAQPIKFEGERDNKPSSFHAECPQLDNSWWTIGAFQTPFDLPRSSSKTGLSVCLPDARPGENLTENEIFQAGRKTPPVGGTAASTRSNSKMEARGEERPRGTQRGSWPAAGKDMPGRIFDSTV
jgi:hypothetical protein